MIKEGRKGVGEVSCGIGSWDMDSTLLFGATAGVGREVSRRATTEGGRKGASGTSWRQEGDVKGAEGVSETSWRQEGDVKGAEGVEGLTPEVIK